MHFGNLRLLVQKKKFSDLNEALSESLLMIKFASDSSTFQLMTQDLFLTMTDTLITIARPIIGYMPRSDIYTTHDKNESEFQSVEFASLDDAWRYFLGSKGVGSHLRVSDDKFYFESPMLN